MQRVIGRALVPVLVGLAVGGVWLLVADRWYWTASDGQLTMGEAAASGQFRAIAWFVALGMVASALWGAVVTLRSASSWRLVPTMVVGALLASVVAWQVGLLLGPQDPEAQPGLSDGDKVAAQFVVDSLAPFLLWPVAALAAVLMVTIFGARRPRR